jgi:DNA-binding transcriptional ArsR family regulator
MLETLVGGPATAGELAALLPIARPGVSRHLRVLREAGLVEVRQDAQRRVYSLRAAPLAEVDEWLGPYHIESTGRVEVCEPPRRLRVTTRETDESYRKGHGVPPFDAAIEASLTADGDQTILVIDVRGMPLDKIAFYGAGWQIHPENLALHIAGRERGDTEARWDELVPAYQALAADVS